MFLVTEFLDPRKGNLSVVVFSAAQYVFRGFGDPHGSPRTTLAGMFAGLTHQHMGRMQSSGQVCLGLCMEA